MITMLKIMFYKNVIRESLIKNNEHTPVIVKFCNIKIIRLINNFYK